jgi:hypothetical protein
MYLDAISSHLISPTSDEDMKLGKEPGAYRYLIGEEGPVRRSKERARRLNVLQTACCQIPGACQIP